MKLHVDVSVIVGANEDLVFECLESFLREAPAQHCFQIFVTCNRPKTSVPASLHARFDTRGWNISENERPQGFAANHNAVLRASTADYVFILNDDLVFLPGSVPKLIEYLERPENSRVAMVSPKLLNPDGSLQPSTYSFPTVPRAVLAVSGLRQQIPFSALNSRIVRLLGGDYGRSRFWNHDKTVQVDTFRGACVLARMQAVREVGLMHTATLVGGEETDWHYRLAERGWKVMFFHEAQVMHYGSQTIKTNPRLRNEAIKSFLYFFGHHAGPATFYLFGLLSLVGLSIRMTWHLLSFRSAAARIDGEGLQLIVGSLWRGRSYHSSLQH